MPITQRFLFVGKVWATNHLPFQSIITDCIIISKCFVKNLVNYFLHNMKYAPLQLKEIFNSNFRHSE